jgi:hypothetical protein
MPFKVGTLGDVLHNVIVDVEIFSGDPSYVA